MPPVNDDIVNATVITASSTLSGTTVGATAEADEVSQGYDMPTVWYRIEVWSTQTITIGIRNSDYAYYAEIYKPTNQNPANFSDVTDGFTWDSYIDNLGVGDSSDDTTSFSVTTGDVLYVLVGNWDFTNPLPTGTFGLLVFIPNVYEITNLVPNLSSASVSQSGGSPNWIKDEQYREITHGWGAKGEVDYTKSLHIASADMPPPGWYGVEMYCRMGANGSYTTGEIMILGRMNDMPVTRGFWIGDGPSCGVGNEHWEPLTQDDGIAGVYQYGGPFGVEIKSGDVFSLCFGQFDEYQVGVSSGIPEWYMEVSKIRFTELPTEIRPPASARWWSMKNGSENGSPTNDCEGRIRVGPDDHIYILSYVRQTFDNNDPYSIKRWLAIFEYELSGIELTAVSDVPVGNEDIRVTDPDTNVNIYIPWTDFTIMPNGDMYVVLAENITSTSHTLSLRKYDASGDSWSTITDDLAGHGVAANHYVVSVAIGNDGNDVYVAWGEQVVGGLPYSDDDFWWRCKKYDTGGSSFTELGSGQAAYAASIGSGAPYVRAGDFECPLGGLAVSPGGVPWVHWVEADPAVGNAVMWLASWNGSSWDMVQVPFPNTAVPDHADTSSTYSTSALNRVNDVSDAVSKSALTFCHHDGPSEYPSVFFNLTWEDLTGTQGWGEFVYYEYDGVNFGNEVRFTHGSPRYQGTPGDPIWEEMSIHTPALGSVGGFQDGFAMVNDGNVPYVFVPMLTGTGGSTVRQIGAARMKRDGSSWDSIGAIRGNFADSPSDTNPGDNAGAWTGFNYQVGTICRGKPIIVYTDAQSYWNGPWMNVWNEISGGVVSMNWRSSDRHANAKTRVHMGTR